MAEAVKVETTQDGEQEELWNNDEYFGRDGDDEADHDLPNPIQEVPEDMRVLFANIRRERVEEELQQHEQDEVDLGGLLNEGAQPADNRRIAESLQIVAQEIDEAYHSRLGEESQQVHMERLMNVPQAMFNRYPRQHWQRFGLMCYTGVRLIYKMLKRKTWGQFLVDLMAEQILHLVSQRILSVVGWPAVGDYFMTTTGQTWLMFATGLTTAVLVYRRHS